MADGSISTPLVRVSPRYGRSLQPRLLQLLARHQLAWTAEQQFQHLKRLALQLNFAAPFAKLAPSKVQLEEPETKRARREWLRRHVRHHVRHHVVQRIIHLASNSLRLCRELSPSRS